MSRSLFPKPGEHSMRRLSLLLPLVLIIWLPGVRVRADVKLPSVFSDQMVLQAERAVPVFGTAEPGEEVAVEFQSQKKMAVADKEGKWLVRLDPCKPGGPFEMKIAGKNMLLLKDVLIGEVWIAAGNRKSAGKGKRGDLGGPRILKKKT